MKITQCEMIEDYIDEWGSITPLEAMPPTVANPDTPTDKGEENGNS